MLWMKYLFDIFFAELNAAIKIGFNPDALISFNDRHLVKIYLDTKTGKALNFYACRAGNNPIDIRDLLKAFNGDKLFGLLDDTVINSLCVTYHTRECKSCSTYSLSFPFNPDADLDPELRNQ